MDKVNIDELVFQSTPSARRATEQENIDALGLQISIHALREEGDRSRTEADKPFSNFNPRPPRGGRPAVLHCKKVDALYFNPRPPRGGRRNHELGGGTE